MPLALDAVACFNHPTRYGLKNPARFPSELIIAMPAAAPVPARNAVGKLQNSGNVVRMPIVANVSPSIAKGVFVDHTTDNTSPNAPTAAGIAICHRRSPLLSALRATSSMPITAAPNGIADSKPMSSASFTPVALIIVGNQKLTPYSPITNEKYVRLINQTRPLLSTSRTGISTFSTLSFAIFRSSKSRSSAVSHFAFAIRSSMKMNTTIPTTIDGMPSSKNNHCHECQPLTPSKFFMIQPDTGPPINPDNAIAVMNNVVMRPRRSAGNQYVR